MDEPEVNLARRVIGRHQLTPPIGVEVLVRKYADLIYTEIPFDGADGISMSLKVPGKRPRVVVNTDNPPLRQRFTLAHELGHILIPWHFGTIIDRVDPTLLGSSSDYWEIEAEAYRFAAELLMPKDWIDAVIPTERNLAKVHCEISDTCKVSAHASAIRLSRILPPNIVYASEKNGEVEFSGRTQGTLAVALPIGNDFSSSSYDYCDHHFKTNSGDRVLHWWMLPSKVNLSSKDRRNWRDILDHILRDIGVPRDERNSKTLSINGVVGSANGLARKSGHYDTAAVAAACIQRFKDRPEYSDFAGHQDFQAFIVSRAADLVNSQRK